MQRKGDFNCVVSETSKQGKLISLSLFPIRIIYQNLLGAAKLFGSIKTSALQKQTIKQLQLVIISNCEAEYNKHKNKKTAV